MEMHLWGLIPHIVLQEQTLHISGVLLELPQIVENFGNLRSHTFGRGTAVSNSSRLLCTSL